MNNIEMLIDELLEAHKNYLLRDISEPSIVEAREKKFFNVLIKIKEGINKLQHSSFEEERKQKPKQYEYKRTVTLSDTGMLPDELNSLGKEGWELAGVTDGDTFYFKREIR